MLPADQYVLLVEDDTELREALMEWSQSQGYAVRAASSAEEALAIAAEPGSELGLVITDFELPGLDGASLIVELRHRPGREQLAAVLMTGARNVFLPEGVAFVQKPFVFSKLTVAASAALETAERSSRSHYRLNRTEAFHQKVHGLPEELQRTIHSKVRALLQDPRPHDVLWVDTREYRVVAEGFWLRYRVDDLDRTVTPIDLGTDEPTGTGSPQASGAED